MAGVHDRPDECVLRPDRVEQLPQLGMEKPVAFHPRLCVVFACIARQQDLIQGLCAGAPLMRNALLHRAVTGKKEDDGVIGARYCCESLQLALDVRKCRQCRNTGEFRSFLNAVGENRDVFRRDPEALQPPPHQGHVVARPWKRVRLECGVLVFRNADQKRPYPRLCRLRPSAANKKADGQTRPESKHASGSSLQAAAA